MAEETVEAKTGMVVLDGVRFRREDLERLHPDRVKDAVEEVVEVEPVFDRVTVVPGAVVVGADAQGAPVVDTTESAAGNVPVVVEEGGVADGTEVPGETGGPLNTDKASGKRPGARTRSASGK